MKQRGAPSSPVAGQADGLVVASFRRHFNVRLENGEQIPCVLKGRSATLACGDRVRIARTAGGGAIEAILPRTTLFFRSDAFKLGVAGRRL